MTKFLTRWVKNKAIGIIVAQIKAFLFSQSWYTNLMVNIIPKLRMTTYYALPTNKKFEKWGALARIGHKHLKAGDILLALDEKKLSSKVIGNATAKFGDGEVDFVPSHAALCVEASYDSKFEVAEMTHLDYTKSTWEDICFEATRVMIVRCTDWDEKYIKEKVIPTCLSFEDKKYDLKFEQGMKELICSELVYFSDPEKRLKVNLDPVLGFDPYISPVGLLKGKNVEIIWDSNKE